MSIRNALAWFPVVVGAGFALALLSASPARAVAPDACAKKCACEKSCETKFNKCQSACKGEDKTKCTLKCNNTLLKCVTACKTGDCDCGGGY